VFLKCRSNVFVPEEDWKRNLRRSLIKDRKASKFRNGFGVFFTLHLEEATNGRFFQVGNGLGRKKGK